MTGDLRRENAYSTRLEIKTHQSKDLCQVCPDLTPPARDQAAKRLERLIVGFRHHVQQPVASFTSETRRLHTATRFYRSRALLFCESTRSYKDTSIAGKEVIATPKVSDVGCRWVAGARAPAPGGTAERGEVGETWPLARCRSRHLVALGGAQQK